MREYELVVIWYPEGNREVYTYPTEEEAERAKAGMKKAFGNQLWACVREKRG